MKISTLEYIHKLLQDERDLREAAWGAAKTRARARDGSLSEQAGAASDADKAAQEYRQAKTALEDFEEHEWR